VRRRRADPYPSAAPHFRDGTEFARHRCRNESTGVGTRRTCANPTTRRKPKTKFSSQRNFLPFDRIASVQRAKSVGLDGPRPKTRSGTTRTRSGRSVCTRVHSSRNGRRKHVRNDADSVGPVGLHPCSPFPERSPVACPERRGLGRVGSVGLHPCSLFPERSPVACPERRGLGRVRRSAPMFTLPGTVAGSMSGTVAGSMSGTVHGSMSGTVHGSMSGTVRASMSGTVRASMSGTVRASISGTAAGSMSGTTRTLSILARVHHSRNETPPYFRDGFLGRQCRFPEFVRSIGGRMPASPTPRKRTHPDQHTTAQPRATPKPGACTTRAHAPAFRPIIRVAHNDRRRARRAPRGLRDRGAHTQNTHVCPPSYAPAAIRTQRAAAAARPLAARRVTTPASVSHRNPITEPKQSRRGRPQSPRPTDAGAKPRDDGLRVASRLPPPNGWGLSNDGANDDRRTLRRAAAPSVRQRPQSGETPLYLKPRTVVKGRGTPSGPAPATGLAASGSPRSGGATRALGLARARARSCTSSRTRHGPARARCRNEIPG